MRLLIDVANEDIVNDIGNIIKTSNNEKLISAATYSLGYIRNDKAVMQIIKNRKVINDDGLIAYFVDKNFVTVQKLLQSNHPDAINYALTCVDIAPYKEFIPQLENLLNSEISEDIKVQVQHLIDKANKGYWEHNSKWDKI